MAEKLKTAPGRFCKIKKKVTMCRVGKLPNLSRIDVKLASLYVFASFIVSSPARAALAGVMCSWVPGGAWGGFSFPNVQAAPANPATETDLRAVGIFAGKMLESHVEDSSKHPTGQCLFCFEAAFIEPSLLLSIHLFQIEPDQTRSTSWPESERRRETSPDSFRLVPHSQWSCSRALIALQCSAGLRCLLQSRLDFLPDSCCSVLRLETRRFPLVIPSERWFHLWPVFYVRMCLPTVKHKRKYTTASSAMQHSSRTHHKNIPIFLTNLSIFTLK